MILSRRIYRGFMLSAAVFCGVLGGGSYRLALAEEGMQKLDKASIQKFVKEVTAISQGQRPSMGEVDIVRYLEAHVHADAVFRTDMTFMIADMAPQEAQMTVNKADFILGVRQRMQALSDYKSDVEIKKIKLSRDKKKATVHTIGYEQAEMPTPVDGGGKQYVPVRGETKCVQQLHLYDGVLQMRGAECKTVMKVE